MAQRGYGEPIGGEWGADDDRREDYRDRDRERSWRSGESDRWRERDEDRGFFERAGDEIRSWFGGEDEDRYERDYDRSYGRPGRDFGRESERGDFGRAYGRGSHGRGDHPMYSGGITDRDRERSYGRIGRGGTDYSRESGSGLGRSERSDYQRGFGPSRGGGYWERERSRGGMGRSMTRPGGQQGFRSEYGTRQGQGGGFGREDESSYGYEEIGGTLGGFGNQQFGRPEDQFYMSWRERQMRDLDRDYEDYCREREQSFHQSFDEWRRNRQQGAGEKGELQLGAPGSGTSIGSSTGSSETGGTTGSTGTRSATRQGGGATAGSAQGSTGATSGRSETGESGSEPETSGSSRSGSRSRS